MRELAYSLRHEYKMNTPLCQPLFIPHGGGPCFFMDWDPPDTWTSMAEYLKGISKTLPQTPKAIVVISAHWEEPEFTVMAHSQPPLVYDYFGFPDHTYQIKYPAPGAPALAEEICGLSQKERHRRAAG